MESKTCQNCRHNTAFSGIDDFPCNECSALRRGSRIYPPTYWKGYEVPQVQEPWAFSPAVDTISDRWLPCITEGYDKAQDGKPVICAFDKEMLPNPEVMTLLLAAPKLLKALRQLRDAAHMMVPAADCPSEGTQVIAEAFAAADEAVKEATEVAGDMKEKLNTARL